VEKVARFRFNLVKVDNVGLARSQFVEAEDVAQGALILVRSPVTFGTSVS